MATLAAGDSGKVLSWDGSKWVATTVSTNDATKLPLAGGTMSGAITMGGNNILQAGHITMNPGRYLHLGTYDDSAEATLVSSLTGTHKGAIWYNTTDNVVKHWNGSAAIASGPIADNAVTTAKIADGAVTTPKLFANPGINRIVATDGTLGSTLAPMSCSNVGHVLKWTMANGFQCAADDNTPSPWAANGNALVYSSGNVGVGTSSPGAVLHVERTDPTGTISTLGTAVTGVGTNFTSAFAVGDRIFAENQVRTISAIADDSNLTLSSGFNRDLAVGSNFMREGAYFNAGALGIGTSSVGRRALRLGGYTLTESLNTPLNNFQYLDFTVLDDDDHQYYRFLFRHTHGNPGELPYDAAGLVMYRPKDQNYILSGLNLPMNVNPASILDINDTGQGAVRVGRDTNADATPDLLGWMRMTTTLMSLGTSTNHPVQIMTNNAPQVTVLQDGKVGIGTATPSVSLDFTGRTDAVRVPAGSAVQRPTAANGLIRYNTDTNKFEAYENGAWTNMIGAGGTVTSIAAGTGLTGGTITTSGTLAVNVGTGANQIVQLDASSRLPAVDGSQLTNLNAGAISSGTLPIARGGTNSTTALSNNRLMISSSGAIVEAPALTNGQLLIGSTGAAPVAAALLAGTGISITNGAGAITIATTGAPPTGSAGGDLTGTYPNPTINTSAVTTAKINDSAVTAAKIADGAVTTPKLFTNPGINRIVGTDGTLGSTLAPMSCATLGHVLKWTASGFQCAADDNTGSQWATSGSNVSYSAGNVGIGTTSPLTSLHILNSANTLTTPVLTLAGHRSTPGGNDNIYESWRLANSSGSSVEVARTEVQANPVTAGSESAVIKFFTIGSGTLAPRLVVRSDALMPASNGAYHLGIYGNAYSSLQLSSGGTVNWNSGDVVATHSADALSFTGAANGYSFMNGNVGIGTTSPQNNLHIEHVAADNTLAFGMRMINAGPGGGSSDGSTGVGFAANANNGVIKGGIIYRGNGIGWGRGDIQFLQNSEPNWNGTTLSDAVMTINNSGNVGIGTTSINTANRLQVTGSVAVSGQIVGGTASVTTGALDFQQGNAITTSFDCGSNMTFANLRNGGSYTIAVTGTGTAQCNFSTTTTGVDAGTVAYRYRPANGVRTANSHTIYTLVRVGSTVYVSWESGF